MGISLTQNMSSIGCALKRFLMSATYRECPQVTSPTTTKKNGSPGFSGPIAPSPAFEKSLMRAKR